MALSRKNIGGRLLQLGDGEAVHGDDGDQGKVEGYNRSNDDKICVVYLTDSTSRHHIVHVH